jgi:Na+/H+ antiporter NhaC
MESIKIEQLLEKYENAETSLHEEAVLKDYFNNSTVAPHLQEYQALFGYYAESKKEIYSKPIQLNTKKKNWKWLSVAASVVLLFSVYTGYENNQERKEARIAFENTQMAFQLLSKNMNKGTAAMAYLGEYETTTNKIFKQQIK